MNFCPHCGSSALKLETPPGDQRERQVCQNCGTVHYENPKMIVGCLIEQDGRILMARRGIEPRKGFWNLPAGFLENDETVEEGAIREVLEETGGHVQLNRLHTVYNLPTDQQIYLIFLAHLTSPELYTTPESTELGWFDREDLPWEDVAFSSNTFALERYFHERETGEVPAGVHMGTFFKHRR